MVELLTLLADRCVEVLEVVAAGLMLSGSVRELRAMASSGEAMRVLVQPDWQLAGGNQ